jgi:predicted membrane protein (TIGR00267 family)
MKKINTKNFVHHQDSKISTNIREVIFGAEDGMVSTLGAITGIAAGTANSKIVILSGLVIIAVESISMGIGSYLSNKSVIDLSKRKLYEEKLEIEHFPQTEKKELLNIYLKNGWPKKLASQMVLAASKNKKLMLEEMAYRELLLPPKMQDNSMTGALFMFSFYIIGGTIPLLSYVFLNLPQAIYFSIGSTLFSLFILGVFSTQFTKVIWWKAGLQMFALASIAAAVGFVVGNVVEKIF